MPRMSSSQIVARKKKNEYEQKKTLRENDEKEPDAHTQLIVLFASLKADTFHSLVRIE